MRHRLDGPSQDHPRQDFQGLRRWRHPRLSYLLHYSGLRCPRASHPAQRHLHYLGQRHQLPIKVAARTTMPAVTLAIEPPEAKPLPATALPDKAGLSKPAKAKPSSAAAPPDKARLPKHVTMGPTLTEQRR